MYSYWYEYVPTYYNIIRNTVQVQARTRTLIQLNTELLAFTGDIRVRSQEQHKAALTASTHDNPLPALGALAPQSEVVNVRKLMFVPYPVMRVLLEKHLPPRQAFLAVYTFLESNNVLDPFSPLLDFLRIGSTATPAGSPGNLHLVPGPIFRSDKKLVGFMKDRVLYRDLPFHDPRAKSEAPHVREKQEP